MNKRILAVMVIGLMAAIPLELSAKCFRFSKGGGVRVCVPGTGASTRSKARKICKRVKGRKCGNVTGYAGSCRTSGNIKCYGPNGQKRKYIKSR